MFAQFAGTSLWFAGNAVLDDAQRQWGIAQGALGWLVSSVQLGFITGTLLFAVLNVADRVPSRAVFLISALCAASANAATAMGVQGLVPLFALRFCVGFFLAGIYPVGMKIAASWFAEGLGHALGLLVGALVLGTAFPHLLNAGGVDLPWRTVIFAVSGTAAVGGVALFALVPAGPHLPKKSPFDPRALRRIFAKPDFRAAAFGYFGHMWELYAFWTLVPLVLATRSTAIDVPLWSFFIIGAGVVGCAGGGWLTKKHGSARVAAIQITTSGVLCMLAPLLFELPLSIMLAALVVWGTTVVGDSPQFSTLNAKTAPRELVGTALTIVTCIGFFITIPSIQLLTWLADTVGPSIALLALAPGPAFGRFALRRLL